MQTVNALARAVEFDERARDSRALWIMFFGDAFLIREVRGRRGMRL